MSRLVLVLMLLAMVVAPLRSSTMAQTTSDEQAAADTAVELSVLEATGDFNALYDRIHPDAHAVIPRAAVIGWYQNEFAPLGPGVATVTGVRFVQWTWPVTGQTYPFTAEVSFHQPLADGTVLEDVVRLVQDRTGEWRWFFGRSREFVEEQIATYVPEVPAVGSSSVVDFVVADLNSFWAVSFGAAGRTYVPPVVVPTYGATTSACGYIDPSFSPAAYCPVELTVYYTPGWFDEIDYVIGDFAWITILAHEWGHHVQSLEGQYAGPGNQYELQADCLAGSYARDAATRGLLDPGDVTEAVAISSVGGDPVGLPQDEPGAHGTSDDRVTAFMRGYLDGFIGCGFLPAGGSATTRVQPPATGTDLATLLPLPQEVPAGLVHTGDQERSLAEVAVNYTDPAETELLFRSWGWAGNVTRTYEGSGSGVTLVYVSIHRFGSAQGATDALDYSLADQAASTGAPEVSAAPLGQTTRALETASDVTIYAQQGDVMIRLTVAAQAEDPMAMAESIVRAMLNRAM